MQLPNIPAPIGAGEKQWARPYEGSNIKNNQIVPGQAGVRPGNQAPARTGSNFIQRETPKPPEPGLNIQLQPRGEGPAGGPLSTGLLRAQAFTPMTEEDLHEAMTGMRLPSTPRDIKVAKGMVEFGMPLTPENFTDMKQALAQLPKTSPQDMQAASFLKMSSLPLTPRNITNLSNFITNHPMIGAQLFEIQNEFKRIASGESVKTSKEMIEMLEKAPGLLGEFVVDAKNQNRNKNKEVPKKMARQVGIELLGPGYGQDEEDMDLLKMLMAIRAKLAHEGDKGEEGGLLKIFSLILGVEESLSAQQLINQARKNDEKGFYYLQIPIRMDGRENTGEIRIYYRTDYYNRKIVDEENAVLEFVANTEHLGQIRFHLEIVHGIINMDIGTERKEVNLFIEHYVPVLMESIRKLSYDPGKTRCFVVGEENAPALPIVIQEFEKLERVSYTC